jgi:hypothetical protein
MSQTIVRKMDSGLLIRGNNRSEHGRWFEIDELPNIESWPESSEEYPKLGCSDNCGKHGR